MDRPERLDRLGLRLIDGLGNVLFRRLIERFGTAGAVFAASTAELSAVERCPANVVRRIKARAFKKDPDTELADLEASGGRLLFFDEPEYPEGLRHIHHPPVMLYVSGELLPRDRNAVAIVGSRFATRQGLDRARRLAGELAAAGVTVVSGLARGIDTAAHRGAIQAQGRTVAVLGCGLDVDYPPENRELKARIPEVGAVLTEYPLGYPPDAHHFPVRNRIIAGMCLGLVVVEAGHRSGALISARLALEEGREVFAVPGDPASTRSRGPERLLDEGAKAVLSAEDVLVELAPQMSGLQERLPGVDEVSREEERPRKKVRDRPPAEPPAAAAKPGKPRAKGRTGGRGKKTARAKRPAAAGPPAPEGTAGPDQRAERIFELLGEKPIHIDLLVRRSGLAAAEVAVTLLNLELAGRVVQVPGKLFVKKEHV